MKSFNISLKGIIKSESITVNISCFPFSKAIPKMLPIGVAANKIITTIDINEEIVKKDLRL